MPNVVHFWSNGSTPNFWKAPISGSIDALRKTIGSAEWIAEKAAKVNGKHDGVTGVNSIIHWASIFRAVLKANYAFDEGNFHSHSGAGVIGIGPDKLTFRELNASFENQGFEKTFNKDATFTFHGCNVGDDFDGEYFLVKFGKIFLKNGGGKVMGNTGFGLGWGVVSGKIAHPGGSWVTAQITPGGTATLSGHTFLKPKAINDWIDKLVLHIDYLQRRKTPFDLQPASKALAEAMTHVPGNGSYATMFNACVWLREAERQLKAVDNLMQRPRAPLY